MNNTYVITTEATADLNLELAASTNIVIIPMMFRIDEQDRVHYPDFREMSAKEFYDKLDAGLTSTTTQINPEKYMEVFEAILKEGKDVLHVGFSSALSGSFNSANIAASLLKEMYPERSVTCVDSLCASSGQGLLVYKAYLNQVEGMSYEDNIQWTETHRLNIAHWFMVNNLTHLQRGGRISSTAATIGTILNVVPILHVSNQGELEMSKKERGKKNAVKRVVTNFNETRLKEDSSLVLITHADNEELAYAIRDALLESDARLDIYFAQMSPIIGSHTGKGSVTVHFMAEYR